VNVKFVIPARGGSKGIPGKNIKLLDGLPLIVHSIEQARRFVSDKDIIVSTDSDEILEVIKGYDYDPLFKRPTKLGSDSSGMNEVLLHDHLGKINMLKKHWNYIALKMM
jgi:CMP-N,N'-diacetyllegionaminic acid synthase